LNAEDRRSQIINEGVRDLLSTSAKGCVVVQLITLHCSRLIARYPC